MPEPIPFKAANLDELKGELEILEQNGSLWGAVLIAKDHEVLLHEAFGLADRERDRANTTNTAFNIASVGKQLTASAVLRLAQQGKLELDDPVGSWIDDLPGNTGETVTLRHLLRMESGWGDYLEEPRYTAAPKSFREVSDLIELIRSIEPTAAPGGEFIYSNISFELAGAIIEKASGQNYRTALQELILDPAGMDSSGCFVHEPADIRAVPYTQKKTAESKEAGLVSAYPLMAYRCSPAGGVYSTTTDLLRYQRAVIDGKLLDKRHTSLMLNRFADKPGKPSRFAFVGGIEGANAWVETNLDTGITVVVLANLDPPAAERVALGLLEWTKDRL